MVTEAPLAASDQSADGQAGQGQSDQRGHPLTSLAPSLRSTRTRGGFDHHRSRSIYQTSVIPFHAHCQIISCLLHLTATCDTLSKRPFDRKLFPSITFTAITRVFWSYLCFSSSGVFIRLHFSHLCFYVPLGFCPCFTIFFRVFYIPSPHSPIYPTSYNVNTFTR